MNELTIDAISKKGSELGEGPHWVEKEKALVYVDITQGDVCKYYVESKREQRLHIGNGDSNSCTSFIIPVDGCRNEYVVGCDQTLSTIQWSSTDDDNLTKNIDAKICTVDSTSWPSLTRFNDAKCDPNGRLLAGTMGWPKEINDTRYRGTLYRFDSNLKPIDMVSKVSTSNGLAWSHQLDTFYYIDTPMLSVDAFDYDHQTGNISNRRVVFDFQSNNINGRPDGMTIDQNGNLWVACFEGWQVICVDPMAGKLVSMINLPSAQITSCCFGGPDYSTMFVTSATFRRPSSELKSYPDSGKIFSVIGLGVKGSPPTDFKLDHKILNGIKNSS